MSIRTKILVNNFSAGEISPELHARVDLAKYGNACERLQNWLPLIEGGIMRRPGTRFVASAKIPTKRARLYPFIFSTLQAYMLEFGERYLHFYKDNGQIVASDGVTPIELATMYTADDLPRLKFRQDADTLYIWHPTKPTQQLTRTSHIDWTLAPATFTNGPFLDQNGDDDWRITATGNQLITNGTFDTTTTGWTNKSVATGTFTVSAGAAQLAAGAGADIAACETSFTTVVGVVYTLTFTVGVGALDMKIGTATGLADVKASSSYAAGAQSVVFTATSTTTFIYFANSTASTTHTLDNVSILKPLHTGAAVTLTSNRDTWTPNHVGALWKLSDASGSPSQFPWSAALAVNTGGRLVSNGNVYEATTTGTTGTRPPVHLRGNVSDGGVNLTFINDGSGYAEITGYTSAKSVSAVVRQHLPSNVSGGTSYWAEGAFSSQQGYPACGAFIEQRLAHAGSLNNPFRIDLSETANYTGYKQGTLAASAISFAIASGAVNSTLWMEKGVTWFAGTNGAVYALTTSNDTPITPSNPPNVKEVFSYGSADVQPLKIGGNLLFVQRGGRKVREINYDAFNPNDIRSDRRVMARHITTKTAVITEWTYAEDPNSTVWAIRSDGTLLALTYFPEQDVIAWSRHLTDGLYESVATIPTATGDQTWVIVNRTINGQPARYVEYFDDTLGTDCALTYQGAALSTVAAASVAHLLGKTVDVVASGGTLPMVTVSTQDITFSKAHAFIEIGLPFDSDCLTVRPEIRTNEGSSQGVLKAMPDLTVRVIGTNALKINGHEVTTRSPTDYLDTGPPFVTGDLPVKNIGMTTTSQIRIQQTEPFPAKVTGIFATIDVGDN